MGIEIVKGKEMHLEEIVKLIETSEIGERYFLNKNIYDMMKKGVQKKEVYVALKSNHIVGFINYSIEGTFSKYPYLHLIIINPSQRRKGYGEMLLGFFESEISKNYNKVFLMVGDFNVEAKRLYGRMGYVVVGKLPDFYAEGVNEYLMMKIIEISN